MAHGTRHRRRVQRLLDTQNDPCSSVQIRGFFSQLFFATDLHGSSQILRNRRHREFLSQRPDAWKDQQRGVCSAASDDCDEGRDVQEVNYSVHVNVRFTNIHSVEYEF